MIRFFKKSIPVYYFILAIGITAVSIFYYFSEEEKTIKESVTKVSRKGQKQDESYVKNSQAKENQEPQIIMDSMPKNDYPG